MQKVLVTGGAGLFGISLAQGLLKKKYSVRVLDIAELDCSRLEEKVEYIKGDIRCKSIVQEACRGVDYIFHTAAVQPVSRSNKLIFWEINVGGTQNILEASLFNSIKKIICISSSAPYGIPKESPITEDTEFNPVCDYGRSKIAEEKVCNEYRNKGLDIIILRPRVLVGEGRLGLFSNSV